MGVELTAIGGYDVVGRQSTAVKVDQDAVIIDLGLHLDQYIKFTEDDQDDINTTSTRGLRKAGAIPDWTMIKDWKPNVQGIVITHAHLDHIGAVPYVAPKFDCPIYASPFTIALLRQLIADKKMELPNELIAVTDSIQISEGIRLELIPMTHSTVDCRMVVLHTKYGAIVVDNDYKLDTHPTLGSPLDRKKIEALSGKVLAHVAECLYAPEHAQTPSESVARQMLGEVLLDQDFRNRTVIVSTFSSHIARLASIIDMGTAMGRKVVVLGRSMAKYLAAAEEAGIYKVPESVELAKYGSQINRFFKQHSDLSNFLIVCTGHMGESKAALSRMLNNEYAFRFKPEDVVVLSSRVIPVPLVVANRQDLVRRLDGAKVRVFDNVHVSGHASREDIRWLLTTLSPKHLIPNHGIARMTAAFEDIARSEGFTREQIHLLKEGDRITLVK